MFKNAIYYVSLFTYYIFLKRFPHSTIPYVGHISEKIKYHICKHIFKKCSKKVNIGKGARFGNGKNIEIGYNSSIGMNAKVPDNIIIGENVLMAPNVTILSSNHEFKSTDIPIVKQGYRAYPPTIIKDDVWIGCNCIIMPGLVINKGSIIAAGTVLTKTFPEYSIVGGNPGKLIKSRLDIDIS